MARYDFDGFRVDTVKYVDPETIELFGNAMRKTHSLHERRTSLRLPGCTMTRRPLPASLDATEVREKYLE